MAIKQPKPQSGYQFRHRLAGAVIIVTVAVVTIPFLLHSPAPEKGDEPIGDNLDAETEADDMTASEALVSGEPVTTSLDEAQPLSEELATAVPVLPTGPAWFVRVGTYANKENVRAISKLLEDHGFEARYTEVPTNNTQAVRVWLGPYHDLAKAEQARLQARALTHEKVYVTDQAP